MLSKYKKIKHISGKKYISKRSDWNCRGYWLGVGAYEEY